MAIVSLIRCAGYDPAGVDRAVQDALDRLGGIGRFVKPGNRELLKVNLLVGSPPEKAITTHPSVVRTLIRLVRSAGGVPEVGDCCGFEGPPSAGRYRAACRLSGFKQVCDEQGVELVHLSADSVEVDNPIGRAFKRFTLARRAMDADLIVNLPKLKTHGLTLFTGGVKNNFGLLPGLLKPEMHLRAQGAEGFAQMLVDLLAAVRPALTVMDAVVGMEGDGPRNGRPKQVGAVIASADPVSLDAVACQIVGIRPQMVPTTRLAHEQGVGVGDLAQIKVLGESPEALRVVGFQIPAAPEALFRATGFLRFMQGRLVAKPALRAAACEACWVCVEHCPSVALSENGKAPVFDYDKCIRCYCCQELCPHDAIRLQRPLLARLLVR
ncbi:MAG: DUF362 domain-containing protein [Chloroflexi bacterium]|nr:DUF362 domain-containing protein [Chloroflexota bacterium]